MNAFGKADGGGRRLTSRMALPLPAVVMTIGQTYSATLVDVSSTGARVRGRSLPAVKDEVIVRIQTLRMFGTVKWAAGSQCGIAFDEQIDPCVVDALRQKAQLPGVTSMTLEERLALEDWVLGISA